MIIKSQLYMMPTTEFFPGQCALCGHRAVIKFRDRSSGWQLGDCCLSFVLAAERALVTSGASHPTPKHHEND